MPMHRASFTVSLAAVSALLLMPQAASAGMVGQPQTSSTTTSSGSAFDFAQDSTYSTGFAMGAGEENAAASGAIRDANGNLVITNGAINNSGMTSLQGVRQTGVGTSMGPSATAIGNQLNVVVAGSWNTVIVDSKQINNGDQTANASLNGQLHF